MRPKSTGRHLPPRMLCRTKRFKSGKKWVSYYYNGRDENGRRKEFPLGNDLNEAKRKWAEHECTPAPAETGLMEVVFNRYAEEIIPGKAPRTQRDNMEALKKLRDVFEKVPIDQITPQHIAQYRDKRSAKVRANREIALISHIWNIAREWGYTTKENPVRGVRKNREKPRDYYADDEVWSAVYKHACEELKDAMDLSYLTGQRLADVLVMRMTDIQKGALGVQQGKTSKKLRIFLDVDEQRNELGKFVDRMQARKREVSSPFLVSTPSGKALNRWTLRTRFDKARADAASEAQAVENEPMAERIRGFQFRDIRPKAASELPLEHASRLLGHTKQEITELVYRRRGELVEPTK